MLAPMSWIRRFTNVQVDADTYVDEMIMTGSEVEGYLRQGSDINNVVVGKIIKLTKHENADRLKICQIDIGEDDLLQIVTGADNVFKGSYVPVAKIGALLPNGLLIKKSKLMGRSKAKNRNFFRGDETTVWNCTGFNWQAKFNYS